MISLSEIMTTEPITLGPDEPVSKAGSVMQENRIRHLPIVGKDQALLGLITQRDILAIVSSDNIPELTGDLMRKKVHTVTEDTDLRGAAMTMQRYKIGCLPVVRDNKIVGIITDTDYVGIAINLLEQLELFDEEDSDFSGEE
jgi:CBS domain-containing membrane protein